MADIGTAYVKIEPTAKGISGKISQQLSGEMGDAGEKGGSSFAKGFGSVIGGVSKMAAGAAVAAGAAIGKITKDAVDSFSEYEQLKGGAELLFGNAYDKVAENAASAFSRVQMSQNEYLQQVNGFATGLSEALGQDHNAAADLADRIVTAEADIVAATGNTAENVQNAFNGIMKSNFSMLDNLQIGIKPTKEGMQEVIDKMNELNGTKYEMGNLADMQSAIVDYVKYVGMSEYASKEASGTIQGSLATMGAAWSNLLTGMATEGADIDGLVGNLVTSVGDFAGNIIPVLERALGGVSTMISKLAPVIAEKLPKLISDNLPTLLNAAITTATELVNGLMAALPSIIDTIIQALPSILNAIIQISLGIQQALPELVSMIAEKIPELLPILIESIIGSLPLFIQAGIDLAIAIVEHLPEIISALIDAVPLIFNTLVQAFSENAPTLLASLSTLGTMILEQLKMAWETIKTTLSNLWNTLKTNANTKFQEFSASFKTWLSQLPEQVAYWVGALVAKFVNLMYELPFKIAKTLTLLLLKIQEFGRNLVERGKEMVTEFKERFIEGFNELPEKMLTVGRNIVDGLINGIKNAWGNLKEFVGGLVDNLVSGFTDNLKIGSPSKVFRDEVGKWIPAGLAAGIESGIGTLNSSMDDMSMAVSPTNMSDISAYTPRTTVATDNGSGQALYELLSRYLPMLENQTNVNVTLEGDAQGLFNAVRNQNKVYRRMNGESAFA